MHTRNFHPRQTQSQLEKKFYQRSSQVTVIFTQEFDYCCHPKTEWYSTIIRTEIRQTLNNIALKIRTIAVCRWILLRKSSIHRAIYMHYRTVDMIIIGHYLKIKYKIPSDEVVCRNYIAVWES